MYIEREYEKLILLVLKIHNIVNDGDDEKSL